MLYEYESTNLGSYDEILLPTFLRYATAARSSGLPDFVESFHKGIVDHECDGHVQANTTQSRYRAFIEPEMGSIDSSCILNVQEDLREEALVFPDFHGAIQRILVLGSF